MAKLREGHPAFGGVGLCRPRSQDMYSWSRTGGYEISSLGDGRFSALNAKMPDGRTIEQWYQCDVKGYDVGGTNWKLGKGQSPRIAYPGDQLWQMYLAIWRLWVLRHVELMFELKTKVAEHGNVLSDRFASTPINQARALTQILNEWFGD